MALKTTRDLHAYLRTLGVKVVTGQGIAEELHGAITVADDSHLHAPVVVPLFGAEENVIGSAGEHATFTVTAAAQGLWILRVGENVGGSGLIEIGRLDVGAVVTWSRGPVVVPPVTFMGDAPDAIIEEGEVLVANIHAPVFPLLSTFELFSEPFFLRPGEKLLLQASAANATMRSRVVAQEVPRPTDLAAA